MATAITNMSGAPLPYPSHGRLRIRTITRVRMPRSSVALGHNCFEIHFNPLFHLTSLGTAFSFFWDRLAGLSADIVFPIASFAFDLVRSRNWFYGVSLSVDLETVSVLEEPDFLDGEMILNEDTAAVRDYYGQPFASTGHGMSQQEISMLKTERLSDDDDDGECCSICLERFKRGMVITKLPVSQCLHCPMAAQQPNMSNLSPHILATLGADIVYPIAMFAFNLVRSRNWFYGVSLSVDLDTVYLSEEPADFLDGEMILNDDTAAARDYYEEPFASTGHGMSQQEISMLKTERLSDDDDECCSICLEGFVRGMLQTPPFHKLCIPVAIENKAASLPLLEAELML
nr:E3 ubiquitin-protein ligase At4g11680-like [Ipomoea batatas]